MEFENNNAVTDEQRQLAQTKQVTLQPMNPFLKLEDNTIQVATSEENHANISTDTENTANASSLLQPSADSSHTTSSPERASRTPKITLIVSGLLIVLIATTVVFINL